MIALHKPTFGADEINAATSVLLSGKLAQGIQVEAFENEFAEIVSGRHCVAVSSGTAALQVGLLAAGLRGGEEVIVPSFTFAATANAVRLAGCVPVFADVDEATFCVDPDSVSALIGPRTAAILTVHLYGQPAFVDALQQLASRHGLLFLEDAAQAHGASLGDIPAGAWGDVAAFSFYATKNMSTGEGGMVVTADPAVARMARLLRNQGMEERYRNEVVGFNYRMTELAAALGRGQLAKLASRNHARRKNADRYNRAFHGVTPPFEANRIHHVYHQYTIRSPRRDELARVLHDAGIESGIYYRIPVHRLPAYGSDAWLPVTDRLPQEVLSLPVGPHLEASELDQVIEVVNGVGA